MRLHNPGGISGAGNDPICTGSALPRKVATVMRWLSTFISAPRNIGALVAAFFVAVGVGEHDVAGTVFVATVAILMLALILMVSPRPRFAVVFVVMLLTVITAVSAAKMRFMGVSLHAFDVFFYLRDSGNTSFLLGEFRTVIIGIGSLLSMGVVFVVFVYRHDEPSRVLRRLAAAAILPLFGITALTYPRDTSDRLERYYFAYHLTSSLFVSLRDVGSLMREPDFVRRLAQVYATGPYPEPAPCDDGRERPDIVVALMESAFQPSLYPQMKVPTGFEAKFEAMDGRVRTLGVETFAGGTWITTVGLLTGLPTTEFGWMRPYLPYYLSGRVHNSMIRAVERCGYDTMFITPLSYGFVNEGPFLKSIGFRTALDWKGIGAASKHERDFVYFDAALKRLLEHRAASSKPLFIYVMTMAAHGPFDRRFAPKEHLAGEPYGNGPNFDEYLRRLVLQRRDLDAFSASLAAEPGRNGTILVDFGDHQPIVTRSAAEAVDRAALGDWKSIAYRTYYRITALGRDLARPLPEVEVLDVPFLGVTVLEAAGVPLDAPHRELAEMRDICAGRLEACSVEGRFYRHLKRLVLSGMLDFGSAAR